ncbi:hypothetical protein BQ8482_380072 [Mesorhizobium delmotii]|uniref:Uncharacterized protein n=1 Tax=Mesorhizobium delmotii TaxID=1631247 RepID=A0A2P9ARX2_9HYPH|nr:hypothetical protein BQ8482_380072 [Mesorhizobium delmotii]
MTGQHLKPSARKDIGISDSSIGTRKRYGTLLEVGDTVTSNTLATAADTAEHLKERTTGKLRTFAKRNSQLDGNAV